MMPRHTLHLSGLRNERLRWIVGGRVGAFLELGVDFPNRLVEEAIARASLASSFPELDCSLPDAFMTADIRRCHSVAVARHAATRFAEALAAEWSASMCRSASSQQASNDLLGNSDNQISLASWRTRSRLVCIIRSALILLLGEMPTPGHADRPQPGTGSCLCAAYPP